MWVIEVVRNAVFITALVMIMMMLLEYVHLGSRGGAAEFLKRRRGWQVALGGLLGAVPGCAGGFVVVGLYAHGMVSFGALVAMAVATVGDDGLFLLAVEPAWGAGVAVGLLGLGLAAGWAVDALGVRRGAEEGGGAGHFPVHEHDRSHRPWGAWSRLGWRRAAVLAGLALFCAGVATGWLGHGHEHVHGHGGEGGAEVAEWGETAARWLFALLGAAAAGCVWKSSDHFVDEHLWRHVVRQHFLKVFGWTLGVLAAVEWLEGWGGLEGMLHAGVGRWLALAGAVGLGWIPTAGPNLVVVGLFAGGAVPPEVLVANSIVQDGHASLPLLAETRAGYVWTKAVKTVLALAVFAVWGAFRGGAGASGVEWLAVPEHSTRLGGLEWRAAGGFEMARTEVTVGQWVAFLNDAGTLDYPDTPQVERRKKGGWRAKPGKEDEAAAWVSWEDAEAWCEWASRREGRRVRLPCGDEWEAAARGGVDGARWPLGWRPPVPEEARYAAAGAAPRAGTTAPNGWGLRDMAGNLNEWCAEREGDARQIRGGAWSDRDAAALECAAKRWQRAEARAADTGFRPLREGAAVKGAKP